ncbi:MAG: glycosyltransferase family 2 protein [Deltaproteobacteria bacterium]|nr:glycosyltransferase family 2 protein [Deltaproteobacteria bacterium]MBW2075089.1 glycosyltransferase family 2 protein [Deltaproteobacteria bacterium]
MEKLSVVIITYNEEQNIGRCLESVQWADEIIIVDSFSTDRTIDIARKYTDKIFQRALDGYGAQKNYAISKATNTWILALDADERLTPELSEEILALFRSGEPAMAAYELPYKVFFGNRWVRHSGWYPEYHIRLFRKDKGRFKERFVHEGVEVSGPVGRLRHFVEHYTYRSISDFIQRMDRYSTLSAEAYYKEGRHVSWTETVFRAWFTFVQMYFLKRGFLDGALGFQLAILYSYYTFVKYAKLKELRQTEKER